MTIKYPFRTLLLFLLLTCVYIIPVSASESAVQNSVPIDTSLDSNSGSAASTSESNAEEPNILVAENISETVTVENTESSVSFETDHSEDSISENISAETGEFLSPETSGNHPVDDSTADDEADISEKPSTDTESDTETESPPESVPLPDLTEEPAEDESDETTVGASVYTYINVTWPEFGAGGSDKKDDTAGIGGALYSAATSASRLNKTVEVYVPSGTYYISDVLHIYSNTWLHLDTNATIVRTNLTKEMLAGAHRDKNNNICYWNCTHTGYTQVVNVKVSGGRWNGGITDRDYAGPVYSRDVLTFRHCSYLTISDTIIGDDCAMHSVNIDGVKNLTVTNVVFQNHYRYVGPEKAYYLGSVVNTSTSEKYWTSEALHIDEINFDNYSGAYPLEVLPCLNITVTGCTFRNVLSGVGTHNYSKNNPSTNIIIWGNTFETVYYDCIHAFNFRDLTVRYNNAYNVSSFFYGKDCSVKNKEYSYIQNNTVECVVHKGYPARDTIYCAGASRIFIENNTFRNIPACCIVIDEGATTKTDTVYSEAVINLNLMENAAGKAGESKEYAAIKVGRGCRINAWKNKIYMQAHANASYETYGIYLRYSSKGSILSKNLISGGNVGVYVNEANKAVLSNNEIRSTKKAAVYLLRSTENEMTGNLLMNNSACGLKVETGSITNSWHNCSLWNGEKDLWLIYSSTFYGISTFCARNVVSTNKSQTALKYVAGDVNFDGKLSVLDLQLLYKYVSDPNSALRSEFYMADMDTNGSLTSADVTIMSRRIVN